VGEALSPVGPVGQALSPVILAIPRNSANHR
jgi:hypothetical protein